MLSNNVLNLETTKSISLTYVQTDVFFNYNNLFLKIIVLNCFSEIFFLLQTFETQTGASVPTGCVKSTT